VTEDGQGSPFEDLMAVPDRLPAWSDATRRGLDQAIERRVPSAALAVQARWWQLETWLRFLVYLELRAQFGSRWVTLLPTSSETRAEQDAENAYMPSDASNPLAYLDASKLFDLIGNHEVWHLVAYALQKQNRWDGSTDELLAIRNRIAHVRRPNADDLGRVEQALRDLEPGARRALESFNNQAWMPEDPQDPLAVAWVAGDHKDARRLLAHAERRYDVAFQLEYSIRPWADIPPDAPVSGRSGVLFHASWNLRDGAIVPPKAFWEDKGLDIDHVRDLIVFTSHADHAQITVTFSGADDASKIADAIGRCFDLVLRHRDPRPTATKGRRWLLNAQNLDWRFQVETPILVATEDQPFSIFGA
jgi:Swt1-like HEPN